MKHLLLTTIAAVLLVGCGPSKAELALIQAAKDGNIKATKQAIADGADVNAKNKYENTPLHRAAWGRHTEIVELLITNGADVKARDKNGWTPLHITAGKGHKELVELLITAGADMNAQASISGWTPLHHAASQDHKEIAELLIAKGADVNVKDDYGTTPLDWADDKETADLLRKHGAK